MTTPHAAAQWAQTASLTPSDIDCTTTVVLKILDHKCKMTYEAQEAVLAIYEVVKDQALERLDADVHRVIAEAENNPNEAVFNQLHELRVQAESIIPKPVMKAYKQLLREQLDDF